MLIHLIICTDFSDKDLIQQTRTQTMPTGKQEQKTTPEPIATGIIIIHLQCCLFMSPLHLINNNICS